MARDQVARDDEATLTVHQSRQRQPLPAIVQVTGAKASPARFRLTRGSCVLGAGPQGDVVIGDPGVSRSHASLELVPEGVRVRDLGSRNGTFYLGQRVETMTLALGSRVSLGSVEVRIDADGDALAVDSTGAPDRYEDLVGAAPSMRQLFTVLAKLEGSLANALVEGESGVGKELVGRAIHARSMVAAGPLVTVNCGAVARELVLSELFGHRRGAFTGAVDDRDGAFTAADGGTLFLDEIGELPLDVQPSLLRALESGEVRRVGDTTSRQVRVRVVAATNRDLQREVREGRFREDLFYRLAVVRLSVPPLRDRREDIPLLAQSFARAQDSELSGEIIALLVAQDWPGNVRELRNAVQSYLAIGALPDEPGQDASSLERAMREAIDPTVPYAEQKEEITALFGRVYLERLLLATGGNQSEAARIAGLDRSYLGRMITKLGVRKA